MEQKKGANECESISARRALAAQAGSKTATLSAG